MIAFVYPSSALRVTVLSRRCQKRVLRLDVENKFLHNFIVLIYYTKINTMSEVKTPTYSEDKIN